MAWDGKARGRIRGRLRQGGRLAMGLASSLCVALLPAFQVAAGPIVADGRTDTTITTTGTVTDITTATMHGGNAFNSFEKFSVQQLQTVNLHQPDAAGALINIIRSGVTSIDGTLNAMQGGEVGGNVYMVSPDGLVVGAGGVVNAGALTVSTASQGFAERLLGADGQVDDAAVAQLFAGSEPLSASGAVELYGQINARRLEMRAGARMILDGRISVIDAAGEQTAAPAVNTGTAASATGVSIQGGVIRLHSGGDVRMGGQASARSGRDGGHVAVTAAGDIALQAGAEISADGAGDGGTVFLFADGSALMEAGARIGVSAVAGDGGFIEFSARDRVRFGGDLDAASQHGRAGTVYIDPAVIEITDDVATNGATWILQADERITITGATVSTRQVDGSGASTGDSGDLIITAPEITIRDGARLDAHADGTRKGGLIALLARAEADGTAGLIAYDDAAARVHITGATLHGGAIYVGAYAQSAAAAAPDSSGSGTDGFLDAVLDVGLDVATALIGGDDLDARFFIEKVNALAEPFGDKIPVQVAYLTAAATIDITDSSLTADGNWSVREPEAGFDGKLAGNGLLGPDGLAEDGYEFTDPGAPGPLAAQLAHAFDGGRDALYIHAHAQGDVKIEPGDDPLNLVVAITDTRSRVTITDSALTSHAGNIAVNATAHENLATGLDPKSYKGIAAGVTVSVRDLVNQVVISGGSIDAAGDLRVQAVTGLNHALTTAVDGGKDGKFALGVTVSIGHTLTEAALGGDIRAGGALELGAETLWFQKAGTTTATLGVDDPPKADEDDDKGDAAGDSTRGFIDKMRDLALGTGDKDGDGGTPGDGDGDGDGGTTPDADSKPGFAGALAVDVALDRNDSFVTLGGAHHDRDGGLIALGPTTVAAASVSANAAMRFAAEGEGGEGMLRLVTSEVAALSEAQKKQLEDYNKDRPESEQKTAEEFVAEIGYGVFLAVPVAAMTGVTQAELGDDLVLTSTGAVSATARTAFPNDRPHEDIVDNLRAYLDKVREFTSPDTRSDPDAETGEDSDGVEAEPPALSDILNLDDYLTTQTGASAESSSEAEDADQSLAIGVTVNWFGTATETRAVMRDGARVSAGDAVTLDALAEGFFYHRANEVELPKLSGDEGANNAIGGAINLARSATVVEALVEGGAEIDATALTVKARNDLQTLLATYAGGNAEDIAINAAIGIGMVENRTLAQVSDAARIELGTGSMLVGAEDAGMVWNAAGAASVSGNVGVGASGTVNFVRRDTSALVGPDGSGMPAATGRIRAGNLTIAAENSGIQISAAIAGAAVAGSKPGDDSGSGGGPGGGSGGSGGGDDDMIIPGWLFDEDQNAAIDAQAERTDLPANEDGDKGSAGWAVSGSAALNLLLTDRVRAGLAAGGEIVIAEALDIAARSDAVAVALGGAIAASLDAGSENNALAGGFAVTVGDRDLLAWLRDSAVVADSVTLTAEDRAHVIGVAVGGAGTSRGKLALAGSVAVNVLGGGARAEVTDAAITADRLALAAEDASVNLALGGAVALNLDASGSAGVGLGVAVNVVSREALARLAGASTVTARAVDIAAAMDAGIYGFAASAGVGRTGLAGSVTVNTATTGARALIEGGTGPLELRAGGLDVSATEAAAIWSLAGAIAIGTGKNAVGGGVAVNVLDTTTEAAIRHAVVTGDAADPGAVRVAATGSAEIGTLAAAGAGAAETAVGLGLSGNAVLAQTIAAVEDSTLADAARVDVAALSERRIRSLGGGAAFSGRNAVGAAVTVNVIDRNLTLASLDRSRIVALGDVTAQADARGLIETAAIALGGSGRLAVSGAVTVNIATGRTRAQAEDALLQSGGGVALRARDDNTIRSLAIGAAGSGETAAGAAIAVNHIGHDTAVAVSGSDLAATGGDIDLKAVNAARIATIGAALGASGSTALAGSFAVAHIGNSARVAASDTGLDAGGGAVNILAGKESVIEAVSGAASASGSNAMGAAVTVAIIQDSVTADLATGRDVRGVALRIDALNSGRIDAIAASGSGSGSFAGAGSLVYTQIGRPPSGAVDLPQMEGLEPGEADPIAEAMRTTEAGRDGILGAVAGESALTRNRLGGAEPGFALDQADITRARLDIRDGARFETGTITVTARETAVGGDGFDYEDPDATAPGASNIRSLAGAVGAGGSGGLGAAFTVNLLFGQTLAEVVLPSGADLDLDSGLAVTAQQAGIIQTMAASAGAGGTAGIAGSVTVNVMERDIAARLRSQGGAPAMLRSGGGAVRVDLTQSGRIQSLAGAIGAGGTAGVGVAVGVNVLADEASAELRNIRIDTSDRTDPAQRGDVAVSADQDIRLDAVAVSLGGAGTVGVGGSFAINVNRAGLTGRIHRADLLAGAVDLRAASETGIFGLAGSVAGAGAAAVGLGVAVNHSAARVLADIDGSRIRALRAVIIDAEAAAQLSGNAVAGAVAGTVSITGSAATNISENRVQALLRNTGPEIAFDGEATGGSDIVTEGTLLMRAAGTNTIALATAEDARTPDATEGTARDGDGGASDIPAMNISLSVGGTAGVGVAVSVNRTANLVEAAVSDLSRAVGLGRSTATSARLGAVRGAAIEAYADTDIAMVTANAAAGAYAGVSGLFALNLLDDSALVRVGDGTEAGAGSVNAPILDEITGEVVAPHAGQDTHLIAATSSRAEQYGIALGGGLAGVGAAAGTVLVTAASGVVMDRGSAAAANRLVLDAQTTTDLTGFAIGAAVGAAGVAGSIGVNIVQTDARVTLRGADLTAGRWVGGTLTGGDIDITARADSKALAVTGVGAAGGTAVGAAVQVNQFDSTAAVLIDRAEADPAASDSATDASLIRAGRDVRIAAETAMESLGFAGGGAVGAGGGAFAASVNVNLITAATLVDIGAGQSIHAGRDLTLAAHEATALRGIAGVMAADLSAGVGASLDYASFAGRTQVRLGAESELAAGRDLGLSARADRRLDSMTIVGSVGGSVGLSAALSVIEMGNGTELGTTEGERDAKAARIDLLAEVQRDLDGDQATGGGAENDAQARSSVESVAGFGSGAGIRDTVLAARRGVDVTGTPAGDDVGVSVGTNSRLTAMRDIAIDSDARVSAGQFGGALAAGGFAGVSAGVLVSNIGVGSAIGIGAHSVLRADGRIALSAATGAGAAGDTIDARAFSAGGGLVGISAGVAVARATTLAAVDIGAGVVMAGIDSGTGAARVQIDAARHDVLRTEVLNVAAGVAGIGVVVSDATIAGETRVQMAATAADAARISADRVAVGLLDRTRAQVSGQGAAGGIAAGVNAVVITGRNQAASRLILRHVNIEADEVRLESISEAAARAEARGVAVSAGLSVGASVARARLDSTLRTEVTGGTILARDIAINTVLRAQGAGHNVRADAFSASGGILAGNGAEASALMDHDLATVIDADLVADLGRIRISTGSSGASGFANVSGVSGGLVAIGAVIAEVGQSAGRTSQVVTDIRAGLLAADDITIANISGGQYRIGAVAGSGGIVAGSATRAIMRGNAVSRLDIGTGGAVDLLALGVLDLGAGHSGTVRTEIDNFNATLVGVSGVRSDMTYRSDVDTRLHGGVTIAAGALEIDNSNALTRAIPGRGHNIRSGSGGAVDVPAMISQVEVWGRSVLTLDDGVVMRQIGARGLADEAPRFRMGASSNLDLTDRLLLDAGGAIAVPIGRSSIFVREDTVEARLGAVDIATEGDLRIFSGANTAIHAEVDANSYGLAGAATGETDASHTGRTIISIGAGAELESLSDIRLTAGSTRDALQNVDIRAETRVFNKTAIPIPTDPRADAVADSRSQVVIAEGARVRAVQDVYLYGLGGNRSVVGYGRGTDLYRQVAAEIANAIGGIFGADPVSLDIRSGTSTDRAADGTRNGITVNGYVRAGSRNSQRLLLDQNNRIDPRAYGYAEDSWHYDADGNLVADWAWEFEDIEWQVLKDQRVAADLQGRVDELNEMIANTGSNSAQWLAAIDAWIAERDRLVGEINRLGDARVDYVQVGPITATGGNIHLRGDYVHGGPEGVLEAPGYAIIDVLATSRAFVSVDRLVIPARSGGLVVFNEVPVTAEGRDGALQIMARSGSGGAADHRYAVRASTSDEAPLIRVQSMGVSPAGGSDTPVGTIILNGDVENLRGTVRVETAEGDIDVRGDVSALNLIMEATNGNFIQGYKPGFTTVGGTPIDSAWVRRDDPDDPNGEILDLRLEGQYGRYFTAVTDRYKATVRSMAQGGTLIRTDIGAVPAAPAFSLADSISRITAGKNVFITADILNINGLIQAGRGLYEVTIGAGVDDEIFAVHGRNRTGTVLIHNPAERVAAGGDDGSLVDVIRSAHITSDVPIYYNYDEGRIEIPRMVVQGGQVELVGNIISTGNGRIEALDGFGEIRVNSDSALTIGLARIDTGSGAGAAGVEGVVRITDTAFVLQQGGRDLWLDASDRRFVQVGAQYYEVDPATGTRAATASIPDFFNPGAGQFLRPVYRTTEYRRLGDRMEVSNNLTVTARPMFDPDSWQSDAPIPTRWVPSNLVETITADGGRSASYQPMTGRDLIYVLAEDVVTTVNYRDEELVIIGISGVKYETTVVRLSVEVDRRPIGGGAYLGSSLGGQGDYDYAFVGHQEVNRTTQSPKIKTHDSVRWWKFGSGWRHYEYYTTNTTRQVYEHRLNASHPVDIVFAGGDQGLVDIRARGDVVFLDTVINRAGATVITSTEGSLLTADFGVELNTAELTLAALGGSITGLGSEFRVNQVAGAPITLEARDNILVRAMTGDMHVASARAIEAAAGDRFDGASSGNVTLIAEGSILHADATGTIRGANVMLEAVQGGIGAGASDPLRIDLAGGRLSARAAQDITIAEVRGDLGVDRVESLAGSVTLLAEHGSILDRNDFQTRDIRTEAELAALYFDQLGLGEGADGARAQRQLDGLKAQRAREYREYWQLREAGLPDRAAVEAMAASEFADLAQTYRAVYGWDAATAEARAEAWRADFVAERWALYQEWNALDHADPDFVWTPTAAEIAGLTEGIAWTAEELTRGISAGLVRRTGDTQTRNEAANIIAARDITLIARDSVGELLDDYVIDTNAPDFRLSVDDLIALAGADRLDLTGLDPEGAVSFEDGIIRITQREDLNFAFSGTDAAGAPLGRLRVLAADREIFLGADTAARIAQVHGTGEVQIRIDGAMTDASGHDPAAPDGDRVAVRGTVLVLESGAGASIGTADRPLSLQVLPGGSLNARAGVAGSQNVFVTGLGDLPIEALFAGNIASVHATGAITDNVGSAQPRIVAGNIRLSAASIGEAGNLLGIELTDEEDGRITVETVADAGHDGDVHLDVVSEANLARARIAGGGLITARKGISLFGSDALVFGADALLRIDTARGIDAAHATGTAITGHRLRIDSAGMVGRRDARLVSDLDLFDYYGRGDAATALWMQDMASLTIGEVLQNAHALSETDVVALGDLTLGRAQSLSRSRFAAGGDITRATVIAEETEFLAGGSLGSEARLEAVTALLRAEAQAGPAVLLLRDRAADIDHVAVSGGDLDLIARDAPLRLLEAGARRGFAHGEVIGSGRGLTTQGGAIRLAVQGTQPGDPAAPTRLSLGADLASQGGDIAITVAGDADQDHGTRIRSGHGTIAADIAGDLKLASMVTGNATGDALRLVVGGTLSKAAEAAFSGHLNLDARARGARTTLRLGALDPAGPLGLETDLDRLDAEVTAGDIHISDQGRLTLDHVLARAGNVDIFAGTDAGDSLLVHRVEAGPGAVVVLSSLGDLRSGSATRIAGGTIGLFAFGGDITGPGGFFEATTSPGAELRMLAGRNLRYREQGGDLAAAFMLAGTQGRGELAVEVSSGGLDLGEAGSPGAMRITAQGDIRINLVGATERDIMDEAALRLVRPQHYGTHQVHAPRIATLTAHGADSGIMVGLINLRERLNLFASGRIDVRAHDTTPADGLTLQVADPAGGFAGSRAAPVHVAVIGDGPRIRLDDPRDDVRPLLAGRLTSQGALHLVDSRIGWGEIAHSGPYFDGNDNNRIDGDVYFRQRGFDLYAHVRYRFLDTGADAQVYAFENEGRIGFTIRDELVLTTDEVLVLNRKLGGLDLDGGQGFTADVGVETDLLGGAFIRGTARGGVVSPFIGADELLDEEEDEDPAPEGARSVRVIAPALAAHLRAGSGS